MGTQSESNLKNAASHPLQKMAENASYKTSVSAIVQELKFFFVAYLTVSFLLIGLAHAHSLKPMMDGNGAKKTLSLVGYNYTNRNIESYTVDNASGGDVRLSSPTSGGGGISCCFNYYPGSGEKVLVRVRWQEDGCTYVMKNPMTNATAVVRHLYYKEKLVEVESKTTGMPEFIETHIFPNGSVRVFLTDEISAPLLRLDGERADRSSFPRCKNGKKPQ